MSDPNHVEQAEWERWEREREQRAARHAERVFRDVHRPVEPTTDDLIAQLHALRHHNAELVSELDRLRELSLGYVLGQIERLGAEWPARHLKVAA